MTIKMPIEYAVMPRLLGEVISTVDESNIEWCLRDAIHPTSYANDKS